MTVGSRRLAAHCRELLATDTSMLTSTEPGGLEPQATVDGGEAETAVPQENLEATAT